MFLLHSHSAVIQLKTKGAISSVNFRYHNPNTDEETLKITTKLFAEASKIKLENILRKNVAAAVKSTETQIENALEGEHK